MVARSPLPRSDSRHGTANAYANLGCRCDSCRIARTIKKREERGGVSRVAWLAKIRDEAKHGARTRYEKYGCRCETCRAWSREKKRALRARQSVTKDP